MEATNSRVASSEKDPSVTNLREDGGTYGYDDSRGLVTPYHLIDDEIEASSSTSSDDSNDNAAKN